MIQRVGSYRCALCSRSLPDGATVPGCHRCGKVYHAHCLTGSGICNCGTSLAATRCALEVNVVTGENAPRRIVLREWRPEEGLKDLFRFTGPMPRRRYVTITASVYAPLLVLFFALAVNEMTAPPDLLLALSLPVLVVLWVGAATSVRRWNELGRGPLWCLLELIPWLGLLPLFYKGASRGDSDLVL